MIKRDFWIRASKILLNVHFLKVFSFSPTQDGGTKSPSLQFSPCNFYKRRTFWLLVLTLLPDRCKISRSYLVPVPNYLTWTKTTPQKKYFFWSNPYKIKVMITSLMEMQELPNFHLNTSTILFESRDKFCCWHHSEELWRHNLYFEMPLF